jgi:hypothetical protein
MVLAWPISPDGAYIAALCRGQLQIMQVRNTISSYLLTERNLGRIAWSPDSKYLAVIGTENFGDIWTSFGSSFEIWNPFQRQIVRSYNRGTAPVPDALGWSPDGKVIIVIGVSYTQESWDGI